MFLPPPSLCQYSFSASAWVRGWDHRRHHRPAFLSVWVFFLLPSKNKPFTVPLFLIVFDPTLCPSPYRSTFWILISISLFSSPFLPRCSTQFIFHLCSSILGLLCRRFIPSYAFLILFSNLFLNFHHSPSACQFPSHFTRRSSAVCWKTTFQHFAGPF